MNHEYRTWPHIWWLLPVALVVLASMGAFYAGTYTFYHLMLAP